MKRLRVAFSLSLACNSTTIMFHNEMKKLDDTQKAFIFPKKKKKKVSQYRELEAR